MSQTRLQAYKDIMAAIVSRPQEFSLAGRTFRIYPESLGKSIVMSSLVAQLDTTTGLTTTVEALALCHNQRDVVCDIIALAVSETKAEIFNVRSLRSKAAFFDKHLGDTDMASLLLNVLATMQADELMHIAGIDEDHDKRRRVARISGNNSISFGGLTMFGNLIDAACERYGWTYDYTVWGLPLVCLRMMLADAVTSMYLSEEDRKKAHIIDRSDDFYQAENTDIDTLRKLTEG